MTGPFLRRAPFGALLVASVLMAAACGLRTSSDPEELSRENLPAELGGRDESPVTVPDGEDLEAVELWFVRETPGEDRVLEALETDVQQGPSPGILLERLFRFPGDELAREGMRSAVPWESKVSENPTFDSDSDVLKLDLSETFYDELAEGDERYAYGQIVLTMADRFPIDAVQFLLDGEEVPVTDGRGSEHRSGLVGRADYLDLVALDG